MSELTIWTYDWVPQGPRGFVRDLRLRWACEEAGLAYSVRTVPCASRESALSGRQPPNRSRFSKSADAKRTAAD